MEKQPQPQLNFIEQVKEIEKRPIKDSVKHALINKLIEDDHDQWWYSQHSLSDLLAIVEAKERRLKYYNTLSGNKYMQIMKGGETIPYYLDKEISDRYQKKLTESINEYGPLNPVGVIEAGAKEDVVLAYKIKFEREDCDNMYLAINKKLHEIKGR